MEISKKNTSLYFLFALESLLVSEVYEIVYVGDTIHTWTLILSSFASPTKKYLILDYPCSGRGKLSVQEIC